MNPAAVALTDAAARRLDHLLAEIGVIARHQPTPAPARIEHPAPWKPKHPGDEPPF